MDDFQPDDFSPDSGGDDFQPDSPSQPKGMFGKTMDAYNKYVEPVSPVGLLKRTNDLVNRGANYLGEKSAEGLASHGVNPYVSAGVGTAVQMAPDIAMTAMSPSPQARPPNEPLFRSVSEPMARRALGFTKRFLNTPFARGKASQAAEVALEKNIIPLSGNPSEALSRAIDLQKESGEALGSMREAAGTSVLDPVFNSIETARQQATNGLRGGAWDTVHRKFDEAQETLMALLNNNDTVNIRDVEQAKKLLSKTVNWVADNVSQESAKQISSAIESGVENIMRSKGIDMAGYEAQKRLYGASKMMQKGLANEVAAQSGNNAISLPTMVMGAGQLATGNVPGAAATVGLTEALRRRGAGIGASSIEMVGRSLPMKGLFKPAVAARSIFTPNPSNESLPVPIQNVFKPKNRPNGQTDSAKDFIGQPNNNRNEQQNQNNSSGNGEGLNNHVPSKGVLSEPKAREYLRRSGGDKKKARQLAVADGWEVR